MDLTNNGRPVQEMQAGGENMDIDPSTSGFPRALGRAYQVLKNPWTLIKAAKRVRLPVLANSRRAPAAIQQRSNRAAAGDLDYFHGFSGPGNGWARTEYGDYYATSVSVYAAVKLRADALTRPPVRIFRRDAEGLRLAVGPSHPAQQLLDQVNPWYTRGDLWRATEIYLSLWGSAFWALEHDENGR